MLGQDASRAELLLDWVTVNIMMGRIEMALSCSTIMMARFTIIKAPSIGFIITFRKHSKDITRNAIANIMNSIIVIIIIRGTNIRDTQGTPQEWKNGRNKT